MGRSEVQDEGEDPRTFSPHPRFGKILRVAGPVLFPKEMELERWPNFVRFKRDAIHSGKCMKVYHVLNFHLEDICQVPKTPRSPFPSLRPEKGGSPASIEWLGMVSVCTNH